MFQTGFIVKKCVELANFSTIVIAKRTRELSTLDNHGSVTPKPDHQFINEGEVLENLKKKKMLPTSTELS